MKFVTRVGGDIAQYFSLVVSLAEMNVLQEMGVPEKVFYHPLTYPSPGHAPGFNERSDFCTIGNFMHPPNMDAVLRLANELWPKIQQQLPDVALHIYGAYPSERAWQLNEPQKGLHIHGSVADLDATLHAHRVLLAPLRFGAGLKGKVMDAWYHGMPVITTPVGAEGLFPSLLWGGSIAETPGDFVDAAVRLFLDEFEWERASARGREILSSQFAIEDHAENLISALQSIDRGTTSGGRCSGENRCVRRNICLGGLRRRIVGRKPEESVCLETPAGGALRT